MTNVLVVDSERSIRNTLKERLEYEGYRVETRSPAAGKGISNLKRPLR